MKKNSRRKRNCSWKRIWKSIPWKKIIPKDRKTRYIYAGTAALLILLLILSLRSCGVSRNQMGASVDVDASEPKIDVQLLDVNDYSRPGIEIERVNGIVIHYTANPGATAQDNRDYFNSLKDTQETSVSSNFVIGLDGEIIQCIPTWEMAYASNERNADTVSIECCHPDETGVFNEETYKSMVHLSAWLCQKFGLTENEVIRHYDVTGKNCPKYFVENEEAWQQFKADIRAALEKGGE